MVIMNGEIPPVPFSRSMLAIKHHSLGITLGGKAWDTLEILLLSRGKCGAQCGDIWQIAGNRLPCMLAIAKESITFISHFLKRSLLCWWILTGFGNAHAWGTCRHSVQTWMTLLFRYRSRGCLEVASGWFVLACHWCWLPRALEVPHTS